MIRKTPSGYKVVSKTSGRNLGEFRTKGEAEKRLREIEYFKHITNRPTKKKKS